MPFNQTSRRKPEGEEAARIIFMTYEFLARRVETSIAIGAIAGLLSPRHVCDSAEPSCATASSGEGPFPGFPAGHPQETDSETARLRHRSPRAMPEKNRYVDADIAVCKSACALRISQRKVFFSNPPELARTRP